MTSDPHRRYSIRGGLYWPKFRTPLGALLFCNGYLAKFKFYAQGIRTNVSDTKADLEIIRVDFRPDNWQFQYRFSDTVKNSWGQFDEWNLPARGNHSLC